jgi:hypothetical protein
MRTRSHAPLTASPFFLALLVACGGSSGEGKNPVAIESASAVASTATPALSDKPVSPVAKPVALAVSQALQAGAKLQVRVDVAAFRKATVFPELVKVVSTVLGDKAEDILRPCGMPLLDSAKDLFMSGDSEETFLIGFSSTLADDTIIACLKKNAPDAAQRDVRGVPVFNMGPYAAAFGQGVVLFGPPDNIVRALSTVGGPPSAELALGSGDVAKALGLASRDFESGGSLFHADEKKVAFEIHLDFRDERDAKEAETELNRVRDEAAKALTKGAKKPEQPLGLSIKRDGKHLDARSGVDGGADAQRAFVADLNSVVLYEMQLAARDSKKAEARNTVARIAATIASAYQSEATSADSTQPKHHLPPSARAIPQVVPKGTVYQSTSAEWSTPGWKDIHFVITEPQYYQYEFETSKDGKSVIVRAHGDLDGNGKSSLFEMTVSIDKQGQVKISELKAKDEDE